MNSLIKRARHSPVFANLLAGFLILIGLLALRATTVKVFPEIDPEAVSITVVYPGAAPEEVERAILLPVEQALQGLRGVRKIEAVASENIASVLVSLESGTNQTERLNEIENAIDEITVIPQDAERPIVTLVETDELAVQYLVYGDTDIGQLKSEAERFRERLLDNDQISDVRIDAVAEDIIDIQLDSATLQAYQLSLSALANRVRDEAEDLSGGKVENSNTRLLVRTTGERREAYEFSSIPILTSENGRTIRLGDIAKVEASVEETASAGYYNDLPAVAVSIYRIGKQEIIPIVEQADKIIVEMFGSHDSSESRSVDDKPTKPVATLWRDESDSLKSRIDLLIENAAIGLGLVFVLLLLFIDLRVAAWVAFGVGVSFIGSFFLLNLTGYTINQLSLFGFILAIGIVVDDAIVVGENVYSKREQGIGEEEAAVRGVTEVSLSVLISTLTTVAVFLPLLFIPGIYGDFMGPIAAVVIFVLTLSLVEAFFILPRHLSNLSGAKDSDGPDGGIRKYSPRRLTEPARKWTSDKLERFTNGPIESAIGIVCRHYIMTIAVFLVAFALSLGLIFSGLVKFVFFPEIEGNYVTATLELSNASSEENTLRALRAIEQAAIKTAEQFSPSKKLDQDSVIIGTFISIGSAIASGDPGASTTISAQANKGFVTIKIEDSATRTFSALDFERSWREETGSLAGAETLLFSSNLVSPGSPVQIEVRSRDKDKAGDVAKHLREELMGIDGVIDIQDDRFNTIEEIQIDIKPEASAYGLSQAQLAREIRASFYGALALRVPREREEVDVRVRLVDSERQSIAGLLSQRILLNGSMVPIQEIANISVADTPSVISRKDGRSVVTLSADVDTRTITGGTVTAKILNEAWPKLQGEFPDVEVSVGGDQEEQQRAGPTIGRNFLVSLFVVYALLSIVFMSYSQPLVIMSIIPFGFMGALLGHFMLGYDLTLLSMFGVIGLSGVVINDSLLIIKVINDKLADEEGDSDDDDESSDSTIATAVREATKERFRPVILTSLTTFLGVTPIILEQSVQAQFLAPTAISLGIGILFATIALIFLLPAVAVAHLKLVKKFSRKDSWQESFSEQAV